jgi:hypothetical protein
MLLILYVKQEIDGLSSHWPAYTTHPAFYFFICHNNETLLSVSSYGNVEKITNQTDNVENSLYKKRPLPRIF